MRSVRSIAPGLNALSLPSGWVDMGEVTFKSIAVKSIAGMTSPGEL